VVNELANFGDKVCVKQLTLDVELTGWPSIINGAYRVRCVEVVNVGGDFEEPLSLMSSLSRTAYM